MIMTAKDLSTDQLRQLKLDYYSGLVNEGTFSEVMGVDLDEPSYYMIANVDDYVSDEFIREYYDGVEFSEDDFFCNAERNGDI